MGVGAPRRELKDGAAGAFSSVSAQPLHKPPTAAAGAAKLQKQIVAPSVQEGTLKKNAKDVFAGTCGGVAVVAAGHPMDTIKVLLSTQPSDKPVYGGMLDAARKTFRAEGIGGLYKGVTSPLLGQMFFRSCLFFSYARAKDLVGANPSEPLSYMKAGGIAWLASSFVECPIDLYKSQMQTQLVRMRSDPSYTPPYRNIFHCMTQSVQRNGIAGPYQGITPTLARNVPAGSLYFFVFEYLKKQFGDMNGTGMPSNSQILLSGALGGLIYWGLIYPVDVIKSSIQTDSIARPTRHYNNFLQTAQKLYSDSGTIRRFYRGLSPCLIRAVPANALMLWTGAVSSCYRHYFLSCTRDALRVYSLYDLY